MNHLVILEALCADSILINFVERTMLWKLFIQFRTLKITLLKDIYITKIN